MCGSPRSRDTGLFVLSYHFGRGTSTGGFGRVLQQGYINGGFNGGFGRGLRQGRFDRGSPRGWLRQGGFNFFKLL